MDSLHTGSKNILSVETDDVTVIIKGNTSHKYSHNKNESSEKCSSIFLRTDKNFTLSILDSLITSNSNIIETEPLFFEQQKYELLIEGKDSSKELSFWHDNIHLRENVTRVGQHKNLLSGIINFDNDIGYSDLVILSENKEILRIRIEIYPSKISYKEDYKALIQDITAEIYNIIFDFLKKTYAELGINSQTKASPVEFYIIIEKIFSDFEKALKVILRNPYHTLETIREIIPSYKAKRTDSRSLKWIQNHPEFIQKNDNSLNIEKILTPKKQITYNTKENQFLKFILLSTQKKLRSFEMNYRKLGREVQEEIIIKIQRMINSIDQTLNNTFLKEVSLLNTTNLMSLVFTLAPGYRDIYKYYLMLQHGLSLTGDIFNLSLKDIADLYEYWCFIKLNRLLKDKDYILQSPDIIKVERKGITVNLKKGTSSHVRYLNPNNQEIIELTYNQKEADSPTGPQKPDNILKIEKKGNSIYQYIFDAKYKIDPGTDSNDSQRQTPGPKEEDINTMHRYRDAIVFDTAKSGSFNFERSMFGAYILFPYKDSGDYKKHRFYKSIEQVNVGGLPFLPSETTYVSNFLEELIGDSPDAAFNRATLPFGIEEKLKSVDWNKKDVLIGMLRSKNQLAINLDKCFYHIPENQIKNEDLPIHWIALYESDGISSSDNVIQYVGEVIRCYRTKRKNISEIPARPEKAEKTYYRFDVKSWIKLETPIKRKEFGPPDHRFTNLFLLENSTIFPELFLKDEEEYRLYSEIKYRIQNPEYVENPFGIKIKDKVLFFDKGEILISNDDTITNKISFTEFLKAPNKVFKDIQKICYS